MSNLKKTRAADQARTLGDLEALGNSVEYLDAESNLETVNSTPVSHQKAWETSKRDIGIRKLESQTIAATSPVRAALEAQGACYYLVKIEVSIIST